MSTAVRRRVGDATSFLFVPGSKPERFQKATDSGADLVILDLEDAVAQNDKGDARQHIADWLSSGHAAMVRVNAAGTAFHDADVAVARGACAVVLPKAERPGDVARLHDMLGGQVPIIALVETPRGLLGAEGMAVESPVTRMAFGNVDFAAEAGVDPGSHLALQHARSQLVYVSAAAGIAPPIDGVTVALKEDVVLERDLTHARELGFTAKLLIHPAQVEATHRVLRPSEQEAAWARAVLDRAAGGVGVHEGQMVDEPVLVRARRIITRSHGGHDVE